MSEGQGIGLAWPLTALGLAVAAMLAPAPAAVVLGSLAVAALGVPIAAGIADCLGSDPERPCGWAQPERETPHRQPPAPAREPEQSGRKWEEIAARGRSVSRSR